MNAPPLTPVCLWQTSSALLIALQERFGDPLDTYVNGSQVWLREDIGDDTTIEWRLHPVAQYKRPQNLETDNVFSSIVFALVNEEAPVVSPEQLWDGLEAFPAYGDHIEPAVLADATTAALGIPPELFGFVDHKAVGDAWEKSRGATSIVDALVQQLTN